MRPLGRLLDLLQRPDDQTQELGSSLAEALKQLASALSGVELRQGALVEGSGAMTARLSSVEAGLARSETLLGKTAQLLLTEEIPLPSSSGALSLVLSEREALPSLVPLDAWIRSSRRRPLPGTKSRLGPNPTESSRSTARRTTSSAAKTETAAPGTILTPRLSGLWPTA